MPSSPLRVLVAVGTRPEAVKLAMPIRQMRRSPNEFAVEVCLTGQHRALLDQALEVFSIRPDVDLDLMRPGQTPAQVTARILDAFGAVLARKKPDVTLVQGDTATTFAAALAAFFAGVPVAHLEAGLRTGDPRSPFPEEMNRRLTARLAALHFAPTERAAACLLAEGEPAAAIRVTGNTGIDALLETRERLLGGPLPRRAWPFDGPPAAARGAPLVLVTCHRRDNFGAGVEQLCAALRRLASRHGVRIAFPVHRNPRVQEPVRRLLAGCPNVFLLPPLDYVSFVDLMLRCRLILTDSGGVQEEAPALGRPALVLRETTERLEAVEAGSARLVGVDQCRIVAETLRLLHDEAAYRAMAAPRFPFGDGRSSQRVAGELRKAFRPEAPPTGVRRATEPLPLRRRARLPGRS